MLRHNSALQRLGQTHHMHEPPARTIRLTPDIALNAFGVPDINATRHAPKITRTTPTDAHTPCGTGRGFAMATKSMSERRTPLGRASFASFFAFFSFLCFRFLRSRFFSSARSGVVSVISSTGPSILRVRIRVAQALSSCTYLYPLTYPVFSAG